MTQGEGITTTISTKLQTETSTDTTNAPQTTQRILPHAYLLFLSWTSHVSSKLGSQTSNRQTPDF